MIGIKKIAACLAIAFSSVISFQAFAVSDADITNSVKYKIANNANTAQSKIEVSTKKGVVYLKGNVKTEDEATTAIEAANSVTGVTDVDASKLLVKSSSSQPYVDAFITAKVKGAFVREKLFGDKPVEVSGISVETKNGVVNLTGTVDNQDLVNTAVSIAKTVKGVKDVKSTVEVKPGT
jgi:hyperosmotically inducible protein